jgi:ankyrin repeat protein
LDDTTKLVQQQQANNTRGRSTIIFPWSAAYKAWWLVTVIGSILTVIWEPYQIAFGDYTITNTGRGVLEYLLFIVFAVDIVVNFNLAFTNKKENDVMVVDRDEIVQTYGSRMFWVDLFGVFPFYQAAALAVTASSGGDLIATDTDTSSLVLYLSLLRLTSLVRLHRMVPMSDMLQYNSRISLIWFTLARNFAVLLTVNHLSACAMYFLARSKDFDDRTTWLGPVVSSMNGFERYVVSLYQSVVTFSTVGYGVSENYAKASLPGLSIARIVTCLSNNNALLFLFLHHPVDFNERPQDFAPANAAEQIWGMIFMLVNVVLQSWVFGSITLLILKSDEKTGDYRDALQTLDQYSNMHEFNDNLQTNLKRQLRLEFNNREIADEQVLKNFPSSVRRKILRKLYLPWLLRTSLMKGVRTQFVDAFLTSCSVEIFSPGEEMVERGSIASDLFLLVGGMAEIVASGELRADIMTEDDDKALTCSVDDEPRSNNQLEVGEFIGEIGFFTESPQVDTVVCLTVCKTLTMPRETYRELCVDHPGSVGRILQNLLARVEEMTDTPQTDGSSTNKDNSYSSTLDAPPTDEYDRKRDVTLAAIKDRVQMYMRKQKDDQTTRFLFAASRGDTNSISLMCDQGFDPNNADYDRRTALMVAAMKGNTDTVKILLDYEADSNLADVHGSTALYEAVKNGHGSTADLLCEHGAELCMAESLAASILCQAVSDGDIPLLRRLLRARIQANASDYDNRTAAHIAAAEGNVAALKVLVEYGADLALQDRWKTSVVDEAKRVKAVQILDFIEIVL